MEGPSTEGNEAARLLVDLLAGAGVEAALVCATVADGSLQVLGQHGYAPDTVSAWRRIPLSLDVPLTRAAKTGVPVFVRSTDDLVEQFPALARPEDVYEALAVVPVWEAEQRVGCLGFSWRDPQSFDDDQRQRVLSIARRAGAVVLRNVQADDPDRTYLTSVLHLLRDPWIVLAPTEKPRPESLLVESVSADLKGGADIVGLRLLAVFPGVTADRALLDELMRLARHGGRFVRATQSAGVTTAPWDLEPGRLRAVRAGRRVVLTWHARSALD